MSTSILSLYSALLLTYDGLVAVGSSIMVLFEIVTIILTWAKTVPAVFQLRRSNSLSRRPLSCVLLYNGAYFCINLFVGHY